MKITRKTAAALICGALLVSAASCANTTGTALTVDGTDIRAGVYISYQLQALNDASNKLSEEQPDVDQNAEDFDILQYSIENTPVRDWIKNRAVELCRELTAVNRLFDEYGLSLADEDAAYIKQNVNSLWTDENMYAQYIYGVNIVGKYYESLGIGKQSFQETYTLDYKKDAIFDYIYGEGGTQAVSIDELNASVAENYALIMYFEVEADVGGAQDYVDKLNNGVSFAEVRQEYDMTRELIEVTHDMEEAEANGEEYDGILPEDIHVDLADEKDIQKVISKDSTSPSEEFVKAVFELANGENKVVTVKTAGTDVDGAETEVERNYVVTRLDITSDEDVMESNREGERHTLKDDELDKLISNKASAFAVSENSAAINKYKVENIIKK